ncbi:hypothetical protein D3C86_1458560 [compost metagenome]
MTVTAPVAVLKASPAGTAPGSTEMFTAPAAIAAPFSVSLPSTFAIAVPPASPLTGVTVVSLSATITLLGVVVTESVLSVVSGSFSSPSTEAVFV